MTLSTSMKQTVWDGEHEIVSIVTSDGNQEVCIFQGGKDTVNTIVMSRDQFEKLMECYQRA